MTLERLSKGVLVAVSAILIALAIAQAFRSAERLPLAPLTEDGYYALSVARHVALGHGFTADGQSPTNGFHPLWVMLLAPLYWLFGSDRVGVLRAVLLTSTAIWIAFAWLLGARARDLARGLGLAGEASGEITRLVVLSSVPLFLQFHNGLETGLALLAILATVVFVDDRGRRSMLGAVVPCAALLAACFYARLDSVFLLVSLAGAALLFPPDTRRRVLLALALCGVLASPWLVRGTLLDGHVVPSSGRAQAVQVSVPDNLQAVLMSVASWCLPLRRLPREFWMASVIWCGLALALMLGMVASTRLSLRAFLATRLGTLSLLGSLALLAVFYTGFFGAPHFILRYLTPLVLLTVPILGVGLESLGRTTVRLSVVRLVAAAIAATSIPALAGQLSTWAWDDAYYKEQTRFVRDHVDTSSCVVGALQTGTLGYFCDRVVNLDGKVDGRALEARLAGRLPAYVDERGIDVLVDWPDEFPLILGPTPSGFTRWGRVGKFEAWVRIGRERCVR